MQKTYLLLFLIGLAFLEKAQAQDSLHTRVIYCTDTCFTFAPRFLLSIGPTFSRKDAFGYAATIQKSISPNIHIFAEGHYYKHAAQPDFFFEGEQNIELLERTYYRYVTQYPNFDIGEEAQTFSIGENSPLEPVSGFIPQESYLFRLGLSYEMKPSPRPLRIFLQPALQYAFLNYISVRDKTTITAEQMSQYAGEKYFNYETTVEQTDRTLTQNRKMQRKSYASYAFSYTIGCRFMLKQHHFIALKTTGFANLNQESDAAFSGLYKPFVASAGLEMGFWF